MARLRILRRSIGVLISLAAVAGACSTRDGLDPVPQSEPDDEQPPEQVVDPGCEGPIGSAQDPGELESCCGSVGGGHHCVASAGEKLESLFGSDSCSGGGVCVADDYIRTGGVFEPQSCTSLGDAPGACLSTCSPKVADKAALLPQDNCADHEVCVPCISPLDNLSTGACELKYTCEEGYGSEPPVEPTEPTCPHEGPALIDVSTKESCSTCGTGHCIANGDIPEESQALFGECDAYQLCVPDKIIETGGNFIPSTCASLGGREGRCMSTCMPDVAAKSDTLPRDTCEDEELCVPCFDPVTGEDTGVCELSCDPGPQEPAQPFAECCGGIGSCMPRSVVPESELENLPQEGECENEENVCLPHMFMEATVTKQACSAYLFGELFGPEYATGVCLPSCLPAVDQPLIEQDDCPASFKCAPCLLPPAGNPTGACEI